MREIKCPTCGKVLKIIKDIPQTLEKKKKKTIKVHCNKCKTDIEQEI